MYPWVDMILAIWNNAHIIEIDGVAYVEYWALIEDYMSVCMKCAFAQVGSGFIMLGLAQLGLAICIYAISCIRAIIRFRG